MSRALVVFLSLAAASCAHRSSCPPIDEAALARRVVDELLHPSEASADDAPADGTSTDHEHEEGILARIPFDELPRRGPANAEIRIVVVSDFECPFCGRYAPTLERAFDEYEGRIAMYFVHYPLPFHPHAHLAAEAAVEARVQGGDDAFYRMHDRMFDSQGSLALEDLVVYAVELGLDGAAMRDALERRTHREVVDREVVDRDVELAESIDVSGTPLTIVGDELVYGAVDYATLRRAIEEARRH